jgi:two-component system response regulator DesR
MPTVVIVDDDAKYRRALTAFLDASFDLDVIADTGSGTEAIELVERLHPDAVVVDVAMPVVNGVEVAERLRALSPELAIVLVTGNVVGVESAQVARLGNARLVAKGDPLPVENALRTLARR